MIVNLLDPKFFMGIKSRKEPKFKENIVIVPPQVNKTNQESIETANKAFRNSLQAILAANFVLNFLMSGLLQYLWGMINALQMIVYSVLFNVAYPPNA